MKRLILLVGTQQSGKTTFAKRLEEYGYTAYSIVKPLEDFALRVFGGRDHEDYEDFKKSMVTPTMTGRQFLCALGEYTLEFSDDLLIDRLHEKIINDGEEYVVITNTRTEEELIAFAYGFSCPVTIVNLYRDGDAQTNIDNRTESMALKWAGGHIEDISLPHNPSDRITIIRCQSDDESAIESLKP